MLSFVLDMWLLLCWPEILVSNLICVQLLCDSKHESEFLSFSLIQRDDSLHKANFHSTALTVRGIGFRKKLMGSTVRTNNTIGHHSSTHDVTEVQQGQIVFSFTRWIPFVSITLQHQGSYLATTNSEITSNYMSMPFSQSKLWSSLSTSIQFLPRYADICIKELSWPPIDPFCMSFWKFCNIGPKYVYDEAWFQFTCAEL